MGTSNMARATLRVQPEILRWARDQCGYDLETAPKRIDVKPEPLAAFGDGSDLDSVPEVRRVADKYRISAAVFVMPTPPDIGFEAPRDFRTLPADEDGQFSLELRKEIDRVRGRLRILREPRERRTATPRRAR